MSLMLQAAFTSACAVCPQVVHRKLAWLSRLFRPTCPQALHRCDVYAALTNTTRSGALSARRRASRPQPLDRIPRFNAALARTRRLGRSTEPLAERVMALMS